MAYDPGALEAALAAAVGEEPALIAELRGAFFASADAHLAALRSASTQAGWVAAAQRLKGLSASFGALRVLDAAQEAAKVGRGDAKAIARVVRALAMLEESSTR